MNAQVRDQKVGNKTRIAKYVFQKETTSKAEISAALGLSMPSTLANVNALIDSGVFIESGEYESTGGRRAKAISIAKDLGYVLGADITAHHVSFVMVSLNGKILFSQRSRLVFEDTYSYYEEIVKRMNEFIASTELDGSRIIGVGVSVPGIVNAQKKMILRSHALNVSNVSLQYLQDLIHYPIKIENDAYSAALAEFPSYKRDCVYLSLSETVGGAIYIHDQMFGGDNFKSGEFGHMIICKDGKKCYCGKRGCVDAYCSAKLLRQNTDGNLDEFFSRLRGGDGLCQNIWTKYLDWLSIAVTNLRMAFDCDIVLGGYVGGYMEAYLPEFFRHVRKYNNFDADTSYIHTGRYKWEASAYGSTLPFIYQYFERLQ